MVGKWHDIVDANSDTYTPVGQREGDTNGDVGDTLTATASYTDGHGDTKTAVKGSALPVAVDTRNKPPAFVDQDTETDGIQNTMATRKVDENTKADATDDAQTDDASDDNVGSVVTATDPDPNAETPTYILGGADAAKFRVRDNGQIEVGSGTELDYETKTTYMVTLTAYDSFGSSSSIMVTIMVNPIDEVPEIRKVASSQSGTLPPNSLQPRPAERWRRTRLQARTSATRWRQTTLTATLSPTPWAEPMPRPSTSTGQLVNFVPRRPWTSRPRAVTP